MSIFPRWAQAATCIGIIASAFFAGRVYERRICQRDTADAAFANATRAAAREVADANFDATLARAGTKTVTNYVERLEKDRPTVERIVTRIRNICVRDGASGVREPLPQIAGVVQEAGGEARNDRNDEFVAALQRDIKVCAAELRRLDEAARYLRIQDGEEEP